MYESQAEQEALENRGQAREEKRAEVESYRAGNWVAGVLTAARRAPYHHNYGESDSFYVTLKYRGVRRQLWGTDLERALADSKSQVRIGDKVGVRITKTDYFTVLNKHGKPEDRQFHHFEVETATYIVGRQRAARRILDEQASARIASTEGKVVTASANIVNAAETLAHAYRLPPRIRANYVEGIKAAAGLPSLPREVSPPPILPSNPTRAQVADAHKNEFYRGAWLEGRLIRQEKATYRFVPGASESHLVVLETSYGSQPIWGTDLGRALDRSKSKVKVGDLVGVRITQKSPVPAANANGQSAHMNRYEIETQDHIARRERLAEKILEDPVRARRAGRHGKVTTGAYELVKAANALADAQMLDSAERKAFLAAIQSAAAIPTALRSRVVMPAPVESKAPQTHVPSAKQTAQREAYARE